MTTSPNPCKLTHYCRSSKNTAPTASPRNGRVSRQAIFFSRRADLRRLQFGPRKPVQVLLVYAFISRLGFRHNIALFFKFKRGLLLAFLQPLLQFRKSVKLLPPHLQRQIALPFYILDSRHKLPECLIPWARVRFHVLRAANRSADSFRQYRRFVGAGPSLKTCPR